LTPNAFLPQLRVLGNHQRSFPLEWFSTNGISRGRADQLVHSFHGVLHPPLGAERRA